MAEFAGLPRRLCVPSTPYAQTPTHPHLQTPPALSRRVAARCGYARDRVQAFGAAGRDGTLERAEREVIVFQGQGGKPGVAVHLRRISPAARQRRSCR